MSEEKEIVSMTRSHLEEVLASAVVVGSLGVSVEALRDLKHVMGVPCGDIVAAFDEWIAKVRSAVTANMEGIE